MVTELEKQFYKTFGIEPFCDLPCNKRGVECTDNTYCGNKYPKVTDHKLLEMICILNKEAIYGYSDWGGNFVIGETVEELKESILTDCIRNKSKVFKQIQQIFKEEE